MTLRVDLGAIAHNLSLVQGIARTAGLNLAPVVKGAFACRPIVEAILSGGVKTLCISPTAETGWLPPIIQLEVLRLSLPEQASSIIRSANASVHTNLETVRAFGVAARTLGRNHGIWIGVRAVTPNVHPAGARVAV